MTRNQLINCITETLRGLPRNARVGLHIRQGSETSDGECGMVERKPNGTLTITIEVNGGAQETRGQPHYVRNNPELAAIHARNGW